MSIREGPRRYQTPNYGRKSSAFNPAAVGPLQPHHFSMPPPALLPVVGFPLLNGGEAPSCLVTKPLRKRSLIPGFPQQNPANVQMVMMQPQYRQQQYGYYVSFRPAFSC